jgi:hypothetical protein
MSVKCEGRHTAQSGSRIMRSGWARQGLKRIIHGTMALSSIILSVMVGQRTKSRDMLLRLCAKAKGDIWGLFGLCIMGALWHEASINRGAACTGTCLGYEGIMKGIWALPGNRRPRVDQTNGRLDLGQTTILHSVLLHRIRCRDGFANIENR